MAEHQLPKLRMWGEADEEIYPVNEFPAERRANGWRGRGAKYYKCYGRDAIVDFTY